MEAVSPELSRPERTYTIVIDGKAVTGKHGIYSLGNGEVMAYGRGAEWIEAIGPVYSSCRAFSLRYAGAAPECATRRADGSSVWRHELCGGRIEDAASRRYRCLMRRFDLPEPAAFRMDFGKNVVRDNGTLFPGAAQAFLIRIPAGAPAYNWYPSREHKWLQLLLRGGARLENGILTLRGRGEALLVAAEDYPELLDAARVACQTPAEAILDSVAREDGEMVRRRLARAPELRDHPLKAEALRAADDTAMLIRAQQSVQGGILAGYNYHMGYVRDQYGVYRGLMALGLWEEARAILGFYRDVFARWGKIANAQSMGNSGLFHVHEYDASEITGYIAVLSAHYLRLTGDEDFFVSLLPLIRWALQSQLPLLHRGMMPFNGDETYIAGGILPRDCISCGALEATYLFVTGTEACLPLLRKYGGEEPWMQKAEAAARDARARYEENFRRPEGYVCDSLLRLRDLRAPEVRHGVCNACGAFGWNHRVSDCWYVCPDCLPDAQDGARPREYILKSVVTTAVYTGSDLLEDAFLRREIAAFLEEYNKTGALPSRPDGNKSLGYDYGLMLYAARRYGLEADGLLAHTLALRDDTGAWVEYYEGDTPCGTFCRPWESGINIEGALRYLSRE